MKITASNSWKVLYNGTVLVSKTTKIWVGMYDKCDKGVKFVIIQFVLNTEAIHQVELLDYS
jgi:hypothetical protein